jgi:FAD binding domain-containing protein
LSSRKGKAPSLALVKRILDERGPGGIEVRALHWSSYFRVHRRNVAKLSAGRIFLAGDAAHIHSPFGGQGMNTGLHDVWNLAWKLDLALRGHANLRLLESYSAERLPVIRQVIETTDLLTKVMGTPNRFAQAVRDTVIPMVSCLAPFQHAFVRRLSELGIAYAGSPIVEGPGERYFDDSLRGGQGILSRFILLLNSSAGPLEIDAAKRLERSFDGVVEMRLVSREGVTLIRPDGYIAFSSAHDIRASLESVDSLLERQTKPEVTDFIYQTENS